jgi:hypothetical protein
VNHVLTGMTEKYAGTIAALRNIITRALPEHASPYHADGLTVSIPIPNVARVADQLAEARKTIIDGIEREQKLRDRISRLESSTGSLMVDRDRGIRDAQRLADGARMVAADCYAVLVEHDLTVGADLETLIEDAVRHYYATVERLDRENQRLDEFRCSIVGLVQQCQTQAANGKGLTPEFVGKLGRSIERANKKACNR